ncbi:hypothetical protein [Nocardiopsis lambiniae]|uniref:Uncharacterized protein n=1 Tax=Nocardiopsis lambiniae TaxID=3075539 RepID=A0ABU2MDW9_9ACTN|nr:hypothetical protein [Nocardiopsis sp. DSM 44743]MDT0330793.1 hypothetical protein [Nocardiopsis sp. DSM 44743]
MRTDYHPTPTEVVASWIPHDARWHEAARASAAVGTDELRRYVIGLVHEHRDRDRGLTDEYDLRSIGAVVEDLGVGGLAAVEWGKVRDALLLPLTKRV